MDDFSIDKVKDNTIRCFQRKGENAMMCQAAKAFRSIEKHGNFYELPVDVYNLNGRFKELVLEFVDGSALIMYEDTTGRVAVTYCRNKLAKTQRTIYVDDFGSITYLLCIRDRFENRITSVDKEN